jgi:hypothetical protein
MNARRRVSVLPYPLRSAVSVTECPASSRSFGGVEPDELDVPGGRGPQLLPEQPGQVARAEAGHGGQPGQRVITGGAGGDGVAQLTQRRGARQGRPQGRRELRLPARTLQEYHQRAGDVPGQPGTVVAFDQRQGQVDARADPASIRAAPGLPDRQGRRPRQPTLPTPAARCPQRRHGRRSASRWTRPIRARPPRTA